MCVSVIIPAYNRVHFIATAIRSALAQTLLPFEVIVVDDGSSDGTADVVEELARTDSRIRCLRQSKNAGPAAARNAGILAAGGEVIAFLDSDDFWEPHFLEEATRVLENFPGIGMVFGEMQIETCSGEVKESEVVWNSYKVGDFVRPAPNHPNFYTFSLPEREAVLRRYFLPIQASAIRREVALDYLFDEECCVSEDVDFLIRLGLGGIRFGFLRTLICHQIIHKTNLLSNANNRVRDDIFWARVWEKTSRDRSLTPHELLLVRHQIAKHYVSIGYANSEQLAVKNALQAYFRSFRACPSLRPVIESLKALVKVILR